MNPPKRAEDAHATLAAAFNTGDVATVMNMYDRTGIIVPGRSLIDHAFGAGSELTALSSK